MKKELFRLYMLVKNNGFKSHFAARQAKMWINGLSDTRNIVSYYQRPSVKSAANGNS